MKVIKLTEELIPGFVEYCKQYGPEQDESYLPDSSFKPGGDDPSVVLTENNIICGAASLILHPEYREIKKGRFRIFHSVHKSKENYSMLLTTLIESTDGIKNIYCFIKDTREDVREIWEELGFEIERYSWVLSRQINDYNHVSFPDGFVLKPVKGKKEEQSFCDIINSAFADMAGHRHMIPSMIDDVKSEQGYLNDGLCILWDNKSAIGTVHMTEEMENGKPILFIQALGVLPGYQRKGLGKNLLRAALEFGEKKGYKMAVLSVNAENQSAANLYLKEGFKKAELFICYNFKL